MVKDLHLFLSDLMCHTPQLTGTTTGEHAGRKRHCETDQQPLPQGSDHSACEKKQDLEHNSVFQ